MLDSLVVVHPTPHPFNELPDRPVRRRRRLARRVRRRPPTKPCFYCEQKATEWDHVLPRLLGGGNGPNLVPCCVPCNRKKGSLHPLAWYVLCPTQGRERLRAKMAELGLPFRSELLASDQDRQGRSYTAGWWAAVRNCWRQDQDPGYQMAATAAFKQGAADARAWLHADAEAEGA